MATDLSELTAIINTFERPTAVRRLVRSIRARHPELRVVVGDSSFQPTKVEQVDYVRLDPDAGAGAGRNALLERVETPYFLQLDDDFQFIRRTRIARLIAPVENDLFDLVAGDCIRCKRKLRVFVKKRLEQYHGLIELRNGTLRLTPGQRAVRQGVSVCDIAPQFFVARTEQIVAAGGWDADLKTEEHEEFFVRLKQHGVRVGHRPDVRVMHWSEMPANYDPFRLRSYRPLAAQKMGVTWWIDMNGEETTYPPATADQRAA